LHHPRFEADCNFYPLKKNIKKIEVLARDEKKIELKDSLKIKSIIKILSKRFFNGTGKDSLSMDQKAEICYAVDKLREKYPL